MNATTETKQYWCDNNGAVYCTDHIGYTLKSLIKNSPKKKTHNLGDGLGKAFLMTDVEVAKLKITLEIETVCMTCEFGH
jgi:hypothetical protein